MVKMSVSVVVLIALLLNSVFVKEDAVILLVSVVVV
jgi:hypothetical protein